MNWNNKITVKKGNIGEQIIRNFFEKKGWIIYKPITNKAHWIDFIGAVHRRFYSGPVDLAICGFFQQNICLNLKQRFMPSFLFCPFLGNNLIWHEL